MTGRHQEEALEAFALLLLMGGSGSGSVDTQPKPTHSPCRFDLQLVVMNFRLECPGIVSYFTRSQTS